MENTTETATQQKVRFAEKKFHTYEAAKVFQEQSVKSADSLARGLCKSKIFARYDGTYDVVLYSDVVKSKEQEQKSEDVLKTATVESQKVHGLTAKARRARDKKA